MTIRMSWPEVAMIIQKHINGLRLGEPRIMAPGQYGGEEQIEAAALEFEILPREEAPEPHAELFPVPTVNVIDDSTKISPMASVYVDPPF